MPILQKFDSDRIKEKLNQLINDETLDEVLKALSSMGIKEVGADSDVGKNVDTIEQVLFNYKKSAHYLGTSAQTQRAYKYEMNGILKFVMSEFPEQKEKTEFGKFVEPKTLMKYLFTTTNVRTRNRKASFLRVLIAQSMGREVKNELSSVLTIEKIKDPTPKAFRRHEVDEILTLSRHGPSGLRNHAMCQVLAGSGIRLNELTQLQICDVDLERKVIWVRPKRHKETKQVRYLNHERFQVLQHYLEFTFGDLRQLSDAEREQYVFFTSTSTPKKPICDRTVQDIVTGLIAHCPQIPDYRKKGLSVHSFRHFFALALLACGENAKTIADLLGHESLASVEIYLRLFDDQLRDAVEQHPLANVDITYLRRLEGNS